ncbi:MAG: hypothetical protein M3131_03545 [Actinomycetota bacterium]|nr:hypothetical protein [Actinomycetota bacterium]
MAAPSETDYRDAVKDGALPAGRPEAGDNAERSVASPRHGPPHRDGAAARAHAAQEGQPDVPPTDEERDEGDADVQVPIDEGDAEPGATQHAPPGPQFGDLAPTGLAVAGFAALGAAAAAAGLGLRRLAR